jgi:site-specific DNA recombinase
MMHLFKHPPLIDLKTFLMANNLLNLEPTAGIAKTHRIEELPLKIFAKDEFSTCPLTGYIKKGHWYYKTRNSSGKINVSAIRLNEHFKKLLNQFEFKNQYKEKLKKALSRKLTERLKNAITDNVQLKKRLTELENLLESIEERYVVGELKIEMYEKYSAKYQVEIAKIRQELSTSSFDSSNLNLILEKGLKIAQNLSQLWVSGDFRAKQKLQYLVFPRGILYNKEKDTVQTEKVNSLFAGIPLLTKVSEGNKKGNFEKNCLKSHSVPRTGFEPAHPFERCHLKAVRLPISPSGHEFLAG